MADVATLDAASQLQTDEEKKEELIPEEKSEDIGKGLAQLLAAPLVAFNTFHPETQYTNIRKKVDRDLSQTVLKEARSDEKLASLFENKRKKDEREDDYILRKQAVDSRNAALIALTSHLQEQLGTEALTGDYDSLNSHIKSLYDSEKYPELAPELKKLQGIDPSDIARAYHTAAAKENKKLETARQKLGGSFLGFKTKSAEELEQHHDQNIQLGALGNQMHHIVKQEKIKNNDVTGHMSLLQGILDKKFRTGELSKKNVDEVVREIEQEYIQKRRFNSKGLVNKSNRTLSAEERHLINRFARLHFDYYQKIPTKKTSVPEKPTLQTIQTDQSATGQSLEGLKKTLTEDIRQQKGRIHDVTTHAQQRVISDTKERLEEAKQAANFFKWVAEQGPKIAKFASQALEASVRGFMNVGTKLAGMFGGGGGAAAAGAGAVGAGTGAVAGAAGAGAAAGATTGIAATLGTAITGIVAAIGGWPVLAVGAAVLIVVLIFFIFSSSQGSELWPAPQALITPTVAVAQTQTGGPGTTPGAGQSLTPVPFPSDPGTMKPLTASLEELINEAAEKACVPKAMIKAIAKREASLLKLDEPTFNVINTDDWFVNADKNTLCKVGYSYNTCTNEIASDTRYAGEYCGSGPKQICRQGVWVEGIMQFEKNTFAGYVDWLLSFIGLKTPDPRIVEDAVFAAARKMKADSKTDETDCTNWSDESVINAARGYYGNCTYNVGGASGDYCQQILDNYKQFSTSLIETKLPYYKLNQLL